MITFTLHERKVFLFLTFLLILGSSVALFVRKRSSGAVCFSELFSVPAGAPARAMSSRVDINTASREELIALPEIGEKTADAILAERAVRGGFRDIAELRQVKGITAAKWERLKKYISLESQQKGNAL